MFKIILTNFSLIFAFTLLVFWPKLHQDKNGFTKYFSKTQYDTFIGVKFGIIGLLLGFISLPYLEGAFYNARIIFILYSGIIGGPIAIFISGLIMNVGRILIFPMTELSEVLSINSIFLLIAITYFAFKYTIGYKNIHLYLYFALLEMSFVTLVYFKFSFYSVHYILLVVSFTIVTFWAIYWILYQSQVTSSQAREMMAMKQVDYLTQLPNNYAIEVYMKNIIDNNITFSYLHIDIDQFKQFNNKYSYLIGDHILQELSVLIKEFSKGKDIFIGRIGGQEFCYIMKNAAPAIAVNEANELRDLIENHTFGTQDGLELKITVSIGISSLPDNGKSFEQIFVTADTALQASKKTRLNQVYHYNQYMKDIEYSHL